MLMPAFFPRFVRIAVGAPVLLIATSQMGLMCGPGDPGPCSSDRFNCDDGRNLAFDVRSDCTAIATPLAVEIGTGYRDFEAFGVDAPLCRTPLGRKVVWKLLKLAGQRPPGWYDTHARHASVTAPRRVQSTAEAPPAAPDPSCATPPRNGPGWGMIQS